APHVAQLIEPERIVLLPDVTVRLLVETLRMALEDVGGVDGKRAVHEDRHPREPPLVDKLVKVEDDILRAANAERRDDDLATPLDRPGNIRGELVRFLIWRVMCYSPVRAFRDQVVDVPQERRVFHDRQVLRPEITGETDESG